MGQKTYFHNITKGWYNENDIDDAVENSEVGDKILFSRRDTGAIMYDLRGYNPLVSDEIYDSYHHMHEYDHVRIDFKSKFLRFHNVSFQ